MKTPRFALLDPPPARHGFTLPELLAVVAVLGLVGMMALPLLTRSEATSQRGACLANKHQIGIAGLTFAADHNDNFPPAGLVMLPGTWMTDVPQASADAFMLYGADMSAFYEPNTANSVQVRQWSGVEAPSLRTLGVALATKGGHRLMPQYEVPKTSTKIEERDGEGRHILPPMEIFWVADATISEGDRQTGRSANNYSNVMRAGRRHESSHLGINGVPEGANAIAVDGHVEWRRFDRMKLRTFDNGPEKAAFWW